MRRVPAELRALCGQDRVIDGLLGVVAAAEVKRQKLRNFVGAAAIELLERVSDGAVINAALAFEQAAVSGLLGERVAKDIYAAFRLDTLKDEFEADQLTQLGFERFAVFQHRAEQPK